MVKIRGKEVESIVLQDGGVLYEKEPLILYFKGTEFKKSFYDKPSVFLEGTNILIDWGDGTIEEYSSETGAIHTYDEDIEHIITISNITSLNGNFSGVSDSSNQTYGITKVTLPNNIREITDGAFYGALITDIFIPPNIEIIGDGVFVQCLNLKNIILSEGLTTIGNSPFAMTAIENIIIPSTVTSMGSSVFGGTGRTLKSISFLWDSEETIIPYNSSTYARISPDNYTFNIPEGTTQLYVDKGYPLAKLIEGATSITLTSDKDILSIGETAIITGTLNYPSQDEIIIFNTKTPESVTMFPGNNYYSLGGNGFDITNFNNTFSLTSNIDNGYYLYIDCFEDNYSRKILSVFVRGENVSPSAAIIRNIIYPIRLHIDENNIIVYYYEDYEQQEVICLTRNLSSSKYLNKYIKEEGFTQWKLSGDSRLTIDKNTGLSALTDSNGQATMEYNGIGAGNVTIKGTYLDKNISNTITIQDLNTPALYLNSDKKSIIKRETILLTTSFSIPQENETIYLSKIINDENLTLELTSTNSGLNHEIKTKVTDENDNGLENIRIKLYKEE